MIKIEKFNKYRFILNFMKTWKIALIAGLIGALSSNINAQNIITKKTPSKNLDNSKKKELLNLYMATSDSLRFKYYNRAFYDSQIDQFLYYACQEDNSFYGIEITSHLMSNKSHPFYIFLKFYPENINEKYFPDKGSMAKAKKDLNKNMNKINELIKNKNYSLAFNKTRDIINFAELENYLLYTTESFYAYDENEDGLNKKFPSDIVFSREVLKFNESIDSKVYSPIELNSSKIKEKEIKKYRQKLDEIVKIIYDKLRKRF